MKFRNYFCFVLFFLSLKALTKDWLFALYHEGYYNIPQTFDILDTDSSDSHKYIESVSPITLFILNKQNDLEVVAIQKHNTPSKQRRIHNPVKHLRWRVL